MRSWVDHVVCTNSFSSLVSDVYRVQLGSNLSDHYPLGFIVSSLCYYSAICMFKRPSIACRHETWMIRAPKCSPMIVLCALLVWRLGLREADDGPTLSNTMYHLYVITVQYAIL